MTRESPRHKLVISAGVTFVFELACGHAIAHLKTAKQTTAGLSYAALLRRATADKGLVGVWDGFLPWGGAMALTKGAVFGWAHALSRGALADHWPALPAGAAEVVAGGAAGGVQALVLSPMLLLRTRVMTDAAFRRPMGGWETTRESARVGMRVVRAEGAAALMKGSAVFSAKRVADWSTRFFFSVAAEDALFGPRASYPQKVAASLAGGVASALVTIPIDVMVAQIQQASKAGERVSVVGTFRAQWRAGGLQSVVGFATRGFLARVAHVAFTTALMKTATSWVYEQYRGRPGRGGGAGAWG